MRKLRRNLIVAAMSIVFCVGAYGSVHFWNKSDFCRGWADHYRVRSNDLETQMLVMLTKNRGIDARGLAICSGQHKVIAEKYGRVADNPFLPYPTAPLVSPSEQKKIETEAEWLIAGQYPIAELLIRAP